MIKKPAAPKKKTQKASAPKASSAQKAPAPKTSSAQKLAVAAAEAAFDKKAFDVIVLDVSEKSPVTDMMVIGSCRSTTHLRAVADNVEKELAKSGTKATHRERGVGGDTDWILLDFFDVMVHLFVNDVRGHYQLERLYAEAKTVAEFR